MTVFDKGIKVIQRRKDGPLTNAARATQYSLSHMKKMNLELNLTLYIKINSKLIKDLKVKI